jgi:hypothetical protein
VKLRSVVLWHEYKAGPGINQRGSPCQAGFLPIDASIVNGNLPKSIRILHRSQEIETAVVFALIWGTEVDLAIVGPAVGVTPEMYAELFGGDGFRGKEDVDEGGRLDASGV